jgi:PAS domain S-box-containing protein
MTSGLPKSSARSPRKERRVQVLSERLLSGIPDCIKVIDLDGKLRYMSEPGLALMEIDDFSQFEGCAWLEFWNGPYLETAREAMEDARAGRYSQFQGSAPTAKGTLRWWDVRFSPINGPDGRPEFLLSISRDITDAHNVGERVNDENVALEQRINERNAQLTQSNNALLGEIAQREAAEGKVRQLQKMEAIGQLTGGIAHDFNNMLAVIIGGTNLIERRLARGGDVHQLIAGVSEAAHRAAALTNRLLAFARQLPLAPEAIDPNRLVTSMADMLRRVLGEATPLEVVLAGGLWKTHADIAQLESALLNLAINARDAMPQGGKLTIETQNCHLDDEYARANLDVIAGQYVMLAVSDTGTGMPPDVIAKALEPFFTTKPVGKGTGLGLSQVYGFIKQSKGHLKIYSEVGKGTAVKIYLPRLYGSAEVLPVESSRHASLSGEPTEIVLLVEDEPRIREIATEALRELGYGVFHASSAASALQFLQSRRDIALPRTFNGLGLGSARQGDVQIPAFVPVWHRFSCVGTQPRHNGTHRNEKTRRPVTYRSATSNRW